MKALGWTVLSLSFGGAATACVMAGASYPVAIWAVAFGVGYKALHQEQSHICPLAAIAAAQEDGEGHVVAENIRRNQQD